MKQNKALHCDKLFIRELRKNLGKKTNLKKKAMKYTVWRSVAIGVIILFIISAIAIYPHLKMIGGTIVVTDDFSSQETPLE